MTKTDNATLFQFFNEIGIIEQLARNRFERALPDGLKVAHFSVLNHFARLGGERSPQQLARAFQVTKGAMTNTLQRLAARGLIEIRPDPDDGRGKKVSITAAGLATRERAIAALAPQFAELMNEFSTGEFVALLPFLRRLREFLDTRR